MLFNQTPKDSPGCPHSSMLADLPNDYEQYFLHVFYFQKKVPQILFFLNGDVYVYVLHEADVDLKLTFA